MTEIVTMALCLLLVLLSVVRGMNAAKDAEEAEERAERLNAALDEIAKQMAGIALRETRLEVMLEQIREQKPPDETKNEKDNPRLIDEGFDNLMRYSVNGQDGF